MSGHANGRQNISGGLERAKRNPGWGGNVLREYVYGACGLYCGACAVEDCSGCQSKDNDPYVKTCKIRICAEEKWILFCNECENHPCSELHRLLNLNRQINDPSKLKNLRSEL